MSSFNITKLRTYCQGKQKISIDEALKDQKLIPNSGSRKEVAAQLQEWGWQFGGRRRHNGAVRALWVKYAHKETIELEIIRLEWLEKRQEADLSMIDLMLEKGFTKEQCLQYLQMLYNSSIETVNIVADEEIEAQQFAEKVEEVVNTQFLAAKMINGCAYMFYVEKYFPGLMTGDYYKKMSRHVFSKLMFLIGDPLEELEWKALSFAPHFLDLINKLENTGDFGDFKKFIISNFLTPETVDKIFDEEVDYNLLAGTCAIARNIDNEEPIKKPYGMEDPVYEKVTNHLQYLYQQYG